MNAQPAAILHPPSGLWIHRGRHGFDDLDVIGEMQRTSLYSLPPLRSDVIVVDIGAHIGAFSTLVHRKYPRARIVAVEACPENIPVLTLNGQGRFEVLPAMCTYLSDPAFLNCTIAGQNFTGRSEVRPRGADRGGKAVLDTMLWVDPRVTATVTIEGLMEKYQLPRIDVLKLDCEGSEFSILENCQCLDQVGLIVGEYHDFVQFMALRSGRMQRWRFNPLDNYGSEIGSFQFVNRSYRPRTRVVFANGCFDLLHAGHVRLLTEARSHGDRLVVAIDSDARVRELKGAGRPVIPQEQRKALLEALACVDEVHVFSTRDELHALVEQIRPDVLAKGPPWQETELATGQLLANWGGRVLVLDEPRISSTTEIVERIRG